MTDRTKKILWIVAAVTGIGIVAIFAYKWYQNKQSTKLTDKILDTTKAVAEAIESVVAPDAEQDQTNANPNLASAFSGKDPVRDKIINNTWDWTKSNDKFSLKLGSYGPKVKKIQHWINELWDEQIVPEDGKFTIQTEEALKGSKQVDFVSSKMYAEMGLNS